MWKEVLILLGGLPDQVRDEVRLVVAILGIFVVHKLSDIFIGAERLFGILPVKYLFHAAHLVLFAKLLWLLISR
jgi:hypothetical protein